MRDDARNTESVTDPSRSHESLKFYFTPVDSRHARDAEKQNPHAKATTHQPEVVEALQAEFGDDILDVSEYAGEQTVRVARARIADICRYLQTEHGYVYLVDLGGIDRFTEEDRYEVYYSLVSFDPPRRLRLKIRVDEDQMTAPTVTEVYRAANWNEWECYDMFGIRFEGHEDMRRMFMPEDFEYHPLRKEFPLLGIPGSLPLPPQTPEGDLTLDPFPAAHGSKPSKSYEEARSPMSTRGEDDH